MCSWKTSGQVAITVLMNDLCVNEIGCFGGLFQNYTITDIIDIIASVIITVWIINKITRTVV